MEISSNLINQLTMNKKLPALNSKKQPVSMPQNDTISKCINTNGISQINTEIPAGYSKIGEITIPGLSDKASIFKLSNGQRVIILPKKGPAYIKTTYNVGSMNETENIRGMSHFIEHNLFNGSKNLLPKEYDRKVSELGGETNASTSFAATDYFLALQLIKDNSLEEAISLNAMQTQFPTFPVNQLQKEKEAVKSEIDVYKDRPDDIATSLVLKNLFNINTASDNFILGTKDNINSFGREEVLDYFNTWYTPDNAVTVITGDVDVDETIKLVSKYYNKPLDISKINKRHCEPVKYNENSIRTDIIQPNASSAGIYMGFAVPEGTSKKDLYNIDVLLPLLMSSNSRLSKALDEYGLSFDLYLEKMQNKPDGAKAIMLSVPATEEQIEDVLKIIYKELNYIANNPPSQQELDNIKKMTIDEINKSAEESRTINSLLTEMALNNDYNYFIDKTKNINDITPADISETARKFLDLNKVSICVSHEKSATAESINRNYNSSLNNKNIVSFGASHNPKDNLIEETNGIKQFKLWNNIETMVIPGNTNGSSSIMLDLTTDELNDVSMPAFTVLNEILNRGSSIKNNDTFNDIKNSKNINIYFNADVDGLTAIGLFNDENISDVTSLMKETLMLPNLSQSEFDRAKQIVKDEILSENISAYDKLNHELYPDLKKYAPKEEQLKQLEALTLTDIQNLYSKILSTSQMSAALTAPVKEKPYLQYVFNNELSQGLPAFKPYSKQRNNSYNIYKPNTETKILTEAEEQAQAEIIQSYKFKNSKNIDDIAKINLLNYILGASGMSSRLFLDLREDKKLAYSVGSKLDDEKDTGTIALKIYTTTDSPNPKEGSPDNARTALNGFQKNVDLLKNQYVSQKELDNAKIKYKTQILNDLETNENKGCAYFSTIDSLYGINHYEYLMDAIDRVTVEDIHSAANYIFQNPPVISIVASKKTLEELNLKSE